MKEGDEITDELNSILKQHGLVSPSDVYSKHLSDLIVQTYTSKQRTKIASNRWVANVVIGMAVIWALTFLYFFRPISAQPVYCLSALGFVLGFWILIGIIRAKAIHFDRLL